MSTITKEQLRDRARSKVKSLEFSVTQTAFANSRAELEEELELARIALASLEAEESVPDELEETRCGGIRKCIAALRYHHKRAETCSNGYTGSTLEEDTLKSINFLKRNNIAAMLQGAEQTKYRAIVERIAEIIHGKVTDIDLLTVTVKSMKDKLQK
ncbi:TPA: hypothetical protein N5O37_001926 [Enterobacter hormaechei subsp. steigerwaltii]|nr:hypothetical protein [Enterobacter hormaechei subsp. steigerwaltii]